MNGVVKAEPGEIDSALAAASRAKTLMQLRQCQAILIPALTGASLKTTAAILGLSRSQISAMRKQFRSGETVSATQQKRGGRRRFLMSTEDERRFLAPWLNNICTGGKLPVASIHIAYAQATGRKVAKSTIYRLLARHGWSK
jgi:transposase